MDVSLVRMSRLQLSVSCAIMKKASISLSWPCMYNGYRSGFSQDLIAGNILDVLVLSYLSAGFEDTLFYVIYMHT